MPSSSLPLEIKALLTDHIDSVSHLETLLLFINNPLTKWNTAKVSKELRSSESSNARILSRLESSGFIAPEDGEYIFKPKDEALAEAARLLHEAYHQRPVAVIAYLYERPVDRLKGFADAFKIKKD